MSINSTILNGTSSVDGAMGSLSTLSKTAGRYANKIQSLLGQKKTPGNIRYLFTNGFIGKGDRFSPNFFVRAFDEPTYLTFRIEFIMGDDYDIELRNNAFNNYSIEEQTAASIRYDTLYDYMPEPFLADYKVTKAVTDTELLSKWTNSSGQTVYDSSIGKQYSTEAYLDLALGEHGRAAILHNFKEALKDIQENFPYYFKSISGLSKLTSVSPEQGARLNNAEITLECMEGLDLKITQLLNAYRKVVWDDVYQRWMLPDMMRYFGMRIYVSEIRMFHEMAKQSSWQSKNVDIFGTNGKDHHDFSKTEVRNATSFPIDKSKSWLTNNSGVTSASAISNAFLGTKSTISKTLNKMSAANTAINEMSSGIDDVFNDMMLCNNSINEVLPTICYECHMCEFNIEDTMSHIDSLASSSHESKGLGATIRIKVGQVTEGQVYPLNKYLKWENGQYKLSLDTASLINLSEDQLGSYGESDVAAGRNSYIGSAGQMMFDNSLQKTEKNNYSPKLANRIKDYTMWLASDTHTGKNSNGRESIMRKRLGNELNKELENLDYSREGAAGDSAGMSLTAALLNEATDLLGKTGASSAISGTKSTATDPDSEHKSSLESVGLALNAAAEKIYNGSDIKSLAISDYMKAGIANKLFDDFLTDLEAKSSDGSAIKNFVQQFRQEQSEQKKSTATSKTKIDNFAIING